MFGNPMRWQLIWAVIVNAIPIAGVLFFGWDIFYIALLYWFEVVAIGVGEIISTLVKGLESTEGDQKKPEQGGQHPILRTIALVQQIFSHIVGRIMAAFVMVIIYSLMSAMYGIAILHFLTDERPEVPEALVDHLAIGVPVALVLFIYHSGLKWAALAVLLRLASTKGVAFIKGVLKFGIRRQEKESGTFLMHIVFLHLATAFTAFVVNAMGSPVPAILFLLVGKAAVEIWLIRHDLEPVSD